MCQWWNWPDICGIADTIPDNKKKPGGQVGDNVGNKDGAERDQS